MVLQVLYNNIRDKSKILTDKRVVAVKMVDDGVIAKTSDGSSYKGDILVGADGIHSTVRAEMWKIANELSPGWIPANEQSCESKSPMTATSTDLIKRSPAITGAFSEFPIHVRALSLVHPTQCLRSTSLTSLTVVRRVVSTGSISSS